MTDTTATVAVAPAPAGAPADAPRIWQAIAAVMRDTQPVGKNKLNPQQRYRFRGIDDLMSAVAAPMRKHGVFILPEVVERTTERRGDKLVAVLLTMRYRIYGPAGDYLVAEVPGEAFDTADKATNKAMSAALKYLLLQVLMIPVDEGSIDDGDRDHPEPPEPDKPRGETRRSRKADPDVWETATPAPPKSSGPSSGPSRDFLAEARAAESPQTFAAIRRAAVAEGAPQHYLDKLDAIAEEKRRQAQQRAQQQERPRTARRRPPKQPAEPPQDAIDAALAEMYAAGEAVGLTRDETDQTFTARWGHAPDRGTAEEITEQAEDLRAAAQQGVSAA